MKTRIRTAITILAGAGVVAAAGGCAAPGPPDAASIQAAPAGTPSTPSYVVYDCSFKLVVAPSTLVIACADDGIGVRDLHWETWTPKLASGYGTFWENDCKPSCAAGHFHYYPALAVLWGSVPVQGHPADRRYRELTIIFTGKPRPAVYVMKNGKLTATYPVTQTFGAI